MFPINLGITRCLSSSFLLVKYGLEKIFSRSLAAVAQVVNHIATNGLDFIRPFLLAAKHVLDGCADLRDVGGIERLAHLVAQLDIG